MPLRNNVDNAMQKTIFMLIGVLRLEMLHNKRVGGTHFIAMRYEGWGRSKWANLGVTWLLNGPFLLLEVMLNGYWSVLHVLSGIP